MILVQVRLLHFPQSKLNKMKQVIHGSCPSKSNSYKIITKRSQRKTFSSLGKTDKLIEYEKSFFLQCNQYRNKNIKGLFEIHLAVFYSSQRPDLDNCLKIVLDCLQSCKAIKNDRNCIKIIAEKFIDKVNPRIEFEIIEI